MFSIKCSISLICPFGVRTNMKILVPDLVKRNQYRNLAANVEFSEGSASTITEAYGLIKNMQFDHEPCATKDYIKNDYTTLI